MLKKLLITELFNITVSYFDAKKSGRYSRVFVVTELVVRACLHVPSPPPSKFIIVPMETDRLTDRMGTEPILPIKLSVSIDTM